MSDHAPQGLAIKEVYMVEIAGKVIFVFLILAGLSLIGGFIDAWFEQRKREKKRRRRKL